MPEQPLLWKSAIEATFIVALKGRLTPELKQALRDQAQIDLDRLLPAYPVEQFLTGVRLTQQALLSDLPSEESERRLGAMGFEGFAQTLIGRAAVGLTRLLGPERSLHRMTQNMRAGTNNMNITTSKVGPGDFLMDVSEVGGLPHFYAGLFAAGMRDTGAPDVVVTVQKTDGHQCLYSVKWTAR